MGFWNTTVNQPLTGLRREKMCSKNEKEDMVPEKIKQWLKYDVWLYVKKVEKWVKWIFIEIECPK